MAKTLTRRQKAAECRLLEFYNTRRVNAGYDFGNGARFGELHRRRREVIDGVSVADEIESGERITGDEMREAWPRVGEPRYRRAQKDAETFGSNGVVATARVWRDMKRIYGTPGERAGEEVTT